MAYSDRIEGDILAFVFKAEDGGFAVARVGTPEEVVAVGALAHLHEGQRIVATGQWSVDLKHGRRFKVETLLVEEPRTLRGLEKFLAAAVDGVGEELARRIVEHFGLDTLRVLDDTPARLSEVPGIGEKTLDRIVGAWSSASAGREVEVTLRGHGVPPATIRRVLTMFGKSAVTVVSREPYRLTEVRGIGFRTADAIARAAGIALDDPNRVEAAIHFTLSEAEDGGSCFLPESVLVARLAVLEVGEGAAGMALERMAGLHRIVRHGAPIEADRAVYSVEMERAEARVARRLRERIGASPSAVDVDGVAASVGLTLNGIQRAAVEAAFQHGVSVITGGPGTGKTTIVRVLAALGRNRREAWLLASPTGRAARRLADATGQEAKTIHRLLEYAMRPPGFTRDAARPLEADGVLIDEASMLDIRLMDALIDAIAPGTRLVLVGDVDQLPSVGAGQVLRDLIDSGTIPVTRLTEVYRQAEDSGIIRNAHRINRGDNPLSGEKESGRRDFYVVPREDAVDAQRALLQVVRERLPALGFDPIRDVQVLTPMHAGPLGTVALNVALGAALNPDGASFRRMARTFRLGDRVIQTKNDYDNDIFNGDVGRVVAVYNDGLDIDFDGRTVSLRGDALDPLDHAWAISIHKSQGSEYPAVVVALHPGHFVLLRRNLLYTAVTRAKKFACIVGSPRAIRMAITRAGGEERHTGLAQRLR